MTERLVKRAIIAVAIMATAMLTLLAVGELVSISAGPEARSLPVLLTSIAPAKATPQSVSDTAFTGGDTAFASSFTDLREPVRSTTTAPTTTTTAALPDALPAEASVADQAPRAAETSSSPQQPAARFVPAASFVPDKITSTATRTAESTSTTRVATAPTRSTAGNTTTTAKPAKPRTTTTSRASEAREGTGSESNDHEVILPKIRENDGTPCETPDDDKD